MDGKKAIPCRWEPKESRVAIFTSDKIDFKWKTVTKDEEENDIMIKGSIKQKK